MFRYGHIQPQKLEGRLFDGHGVFVGNSSRYPVTNFRFPVFSPLVPNVKLLLQVIPAIYASIGRVSPDRHLYKFA